MRHFIPQAADLRDLLSQYQLWAHGMFPKGDFASTVSRVETVCRTKQMEVGAPLSLSSPPPPEFTFKDPFSLGARQSLQCPDVP